MVDYTNQEEVTQFFRNIERELPVDTWVLDNVHIWPFIKTSLYFYLAGKKKNKNLISINTKKEYKKDSLTDLVRKTLFKITHPIKFNRFLSNLSQKDSVIYSHKTYRTFFKGKEFNKFFDPLIENGKIGKKKDIYFIEDFYSYDKENLMHSDLILDVRMPYNYFLTITKQKKHTIQGDRYKEFLDRFLADDIFEEFKTTFDEEVFFEFYKNIELKSIYFEKILRKIQPKKLYITCYYCNTTFPITIAAKKLGIEVIEMQHGVMDSNHIPYGKWIKSPKNGYEMMPDKIWNWDEKSKNIIEQSFQNLNVEPFIGGNPWVNYFKNHENLSYKEEFILYTLQPFVDYSTLFPDSIIKSINELKYKWYIRLHPRQLSEQQEMKEYLVNHGANMNKINFDDATNDPLPLLISHCRVHLTQFSSCTIEAALLDKKTLLLDEIAKLYFNNYIENNLAEYVTDDSIFDRIRKID